MIANPKSTGSLCLELKTQHKYSYTHFHLPHPPNQIRHPSWFIPSSPRMLKPSINPVDTDVHRHQGSEMQWGHDEKLSMAEQKWYPEGKLTKETDGKGCVSHWNSSWSQQRSTDGSSKGAARSSSEPLAATLGRSRDSASKPKGRISPDQMKVKIRTEKVMLWMDQGGTISQIKPKGISDHF